jgi:Cu/Ag efflux protein CusF
VRSPTLAARVWPALAALASLSLLAAACGGEPRSASTARTDSTLAPPAADATYRVRGEITRLPSAPGGEIWIRHEAIPEFRDREGKVVGMMSMTMPFGVAPDGAPAELAAGDRVEFRLELRWRESSPARAGDFRPLPAGTRLDFDPPQDAEAGATPN